MHLINDSYTSHTHRKLESHPKKKEREKEIQRELVNERDREKHSWLEIWPSNFKFYLKLVIRY